MADKEAAMALCSLASRLPVPSERTARMATTQRIQATVAAVAVADSVLS
jgi:hypothetical protein